MLVVIEGLDFSGKTTYAKAICEKFNGEYYHFPNLKLESGRLIDNIINGRNTNGKKYSNEDLQWLYQQNRLETMDLIKKDIESNKIVVCDRYGYSGYLYSLGLNCPENFAKQMKRNLVKPNLRIYIRCSTEVLFQRRTERSNIDNFEKDDLFQMKLYKLYEDYIYAKKQKWHITRMNDSFEDNLKEICDKIVDMYKK